MAKKGKGKAKPPNGGGEQLPRQEQPSSIQREEEQELGQLLSNPVGLPLKRIGSYLSFSR